MAKEDNKFGNPVVTPKGTLYFFDLDTPNTKEKHPNNQYPSDKYDVTMGFPATADLSKIKAECEKVAKEAFGSVEGVEMPFTNGDEKNMDSMAGKIIIRAKSSKRGGLVDGDRQRITEAEVKAGMWARLQVTPMSYKSGKTKGVTFLLKNTQVLTEVEYDNLGGGQAAESVEWGDDDDFDA
jgi:hypothetical protein